MQKTLLTVAAVVLTVALLYNPLNLVIDRYTFDHSSYVSHAFTLALDFDLDYSNEPLDPSAIGPSGLYPRNPIGPGLMMAPFVALFSPLDHLQANPIIKDHSKFQYSWSHFGIWFSAAFYFMTGVWLYCTAIERYTTKISRLQIIFLSASFGIAHYVTYVPAWGHGYEFFTTALTFWAAAVLLSRIQNRQGLTKVILACSVGIVLTISTRPANLNILILPVLVLLALVHFTENSALDQYTQRQWLKLTGKFLGAITLCYLPIGVINIYMYGFPFPSPTMMYGVTENLNILNDITDLSSAIDLGLKLIPNFGKLIFSSEFGLLYSSPIFIFGFCLFLFIIFKQFNKNRKLSFILAGLLFAYTGLPIAIVLLWRTTASDYGYRYLYSLYPVAILGYTLWMHYYDNYNGKLSSSQLLSNKLIISALIILSLFGLLGQVFYNSTDQLRLKSQVNTYGVQHCCSGNGYETALLKEVFTPRTWYVVSSKRVPGFIAGGMLGYIEGGWSEKVIQNIVSNLGLNYPGLSSVLKAQVKNVPGRIYFQLGVLLTFVFWALYAILGREK